MNLTPEQLAALRDLALALPKRRIKKKTGTGSPKPGPRPKPKPQRNHDDEAQWVVDVMRSNGGTAEVNLYRWVVGRRFLKALGYAEKRGMVREDKRTKPSRRIFYLTPMGMLPRKSRVAAVKEFHRR